jgi:hypothetical protein
MRLISRCEADDVRTATKPKRICKVNGRYYNLTETKMMSLATTPSPSATLAPWCIYRRKTTLASCISTAFRAAADRSEVRDCGADQADDYLRALRLLLRGVSKRD